MEDNFYSSLNIDDAHVIEWLGQLVGDHSAKLREAVRDAEVAHMADVFGFLVAEDERRDEELANRQTATVVKEGADAAPVVAEASVIVETASQRQERRYQACVAAGLKMPTDDYSHLPRGINKLAAEEGIKRQSYSEDVKAHITRLNAR
jgi:hypothetical protein